MIVCGGGGRGVLGLLNCNSDVSSFVLTKIDLLDVFQESKFLKFLGFMWNPLSWVMEAAAIMAIALANGGVRTRR